MGDKHRKGKSSSQGGWFDAVIPDKRDRESLIQELNSPE